MLYRSPLLPAERSGNYKWFSVLGGRCNRRTGEVLSICVFHVSGSPTAFVLLSELFFYNEAIAIFLPKKFERRGAFILNHQGPILQRGRILIVSRNNFLALLITRVSQQLKTKGVLQKRKVTWLCLKNKRRLTGFQQKVFTSCYIIKVNEC